MVLENTSNNTILSLIVSGNYITEQLNGFMKRYDLTVQQYNILRILRGQKGVATNLFVLQKHMIHKMSNTTRLVEKLKIKKLLERKVCEENRRKVDIFITDKGLDLLETMNEDLINFEKKLTENLNQEELKQIVFLLNKLKQ